MVLGSGANKCPNADPKKPKPEGEEQKPLKPPKGWGLFRRRGPRGEIINGLMEYDEVLPPDLRKSQEHDGSQSAQ